MSGKPELDKRASLAGPREISDLARTFNDMLDSLQQKTNSLDNELRERGARRSFDHLAHYDSVTGLANRVHFHKELPGPRSAPADSTPTSPWFTSISTTSRW